MMGHSPDDGVGDGEKAEFDASNLSRNSTGSRSEKPQASAIGSHLPVVWSPQLDAEEEMDPPVIGADAPPHFDAAEEMSQPADEAPTQAQSEAAPASQTRSSRFALLAASIALAAALGSFLGSLAGSGVARFLPAGAAPSGATEVSNATQAAKLQLAELAAIKSSLDNATRSANAQFAKIGDRLDGVERAEDPTKLAHIADVVERLDKQSSAAPEITGSIAASSPPVSAAKPADKILDGWIVEDVHGAQALVASRRGGEFLVMAGSILPGLGAVESVKRQDGQWVVVTAGGLITSGR